MKSLILALMLHPATDLPLVSYTPTFTVQGNAHAQQAEVNGETVTLPLAQPGSLTRTVTLQPGKNWVRVKQGEHWQTFKVLYLLRPRDLYEAEPEPQGLTYLATLQFLPVDGAGRIHPQHPLTLAELCRVLYLLRQPPQLSVSPLSTDHHALARDKGWLEGLLQVPAETPITWAQLEQVLSNYYSERPLRLEMPFPRTDAQVRRQDLGRLFLHLPEGRQQVKTLQDPAVGYQK